MKAISTNLSNTSFIPTRFYLNARKHGGRYRRGVHDVLSVDGILPIVTSEAAPCPLQPCYFAKWDIFADTSDHQYVMGFPVCI
jgi:hypothetical protein